MSELCIQKFMRELSKRNNKKHTKELKNNNFSGIDLVIVNFYPFENVLKKRMTVKKLLKY